MYLATAVCKGAVHLVNDDRVTDIGHLNVPEGYIGDDRAYGGVFPSFDTHTICGPGDVAVPDHEPPHILFVCVLPQAANAETMAWPTVDSCNEYIGVAMAD